MEKLISLIRELAVVPSFSSFEERIHNQVLNAMEAVRGAEMQRVPDNNLVFTIPGDASRPPVALSAHLDKINHFGADHPEVLPFGHDDDRLIGQLDNVVGLALCISLARESAHRSFPPLMLMFSEMEEGFGLKHHPHLLKNGGKGLHHGMGAERIARHLVTNGMLPSAVITLDTTPLFRGQPGVALYSGHWEFTGQMPSEGERLRTERVRDQLISIDSGLHLANNTNDYLHYGAELNRDGKADIPSLALEPAIFPYHQKNESVYLKDIARVHDIMVRWLEQTDRGI